MRYIIILTLILIQTSFADTLSLKNGSKVEGKLISISGDSIKITDKEVPLKDAAKLNVDTFSVPAKESSIILKNGTLLSGVVRKVGIKAIEFQTAAFGLVEIPRPEVSGLVFTGEQVSTQTVPKGKVILLLKDKSEVTGGLMWVKAESVGVLTTKGLQNIPAPKINSIKFADQDTVKGVSVTLRNGDKLSGNVNWQRQELECLFGKNKYKIKIKAISEINF